MADQGASDREGRQPAAEASADIVQEVTAAMDVVIAAGLGEELEEMLFRAFVKHEAEWREEFGDDDPEVQWLEAAKEKYGET